MSCLLCFGVERDENLIDIAGVESRRLSVACILCAHFPFCFEVEPTEGYVCQKCWIKVSVFHEFYVHVECVHRSRETIFAESVVDDVKPNIDSDADKWGFGSEPEAEPAYESPHNASNRIRKRAHEVSLESEPNRISPDYNNGGSGKKELEGETKKRTRCQPKKKKKSVISTDYKSDESYEENSDDPTWNDESECENRTAIKTKHQQRRPNELGTFQCEICEMHFLSSIGLERHFKRTHDVKKFKCDSTNCMDSFETQQLLDDHLATKHKRVECPQCRKSVLHTYLSYHIRNHHKPLSNVVCELCGKVSPNRRAHGDHCKRMHADVEQLQCDICGKWYKDKLAIRAHIANIHISGPATCPICGKTVRNRKRLSDHKKTHNPESLNRFKCDICGHVFREKARLQEHSHIHAGTAGSYRCVCGEMFRFRSTLSSHKKKMHPK